MFNFFIYIFIINLCNLYKGNYLVPVMMMMMMMAVGVHIHKVGAKPGPEEVSGKGDGGRWEGKCCVELHGSCGR